MSMWHCEKCLGTPGFGVGCVCPRNAHAPTMDDAIAAGDGTLHGAIDHWQTRALEAERKLAALAAQPAASAEPNDAELFRLYIETISGFSDGRGYEAGIVAYARVLLSRYAAPQASAPHRAYVADMEDTLNQIADAMGVERRNPERLIEACKQAGGRQQRKGE